MTDRAGRCKPYLDAPTLHRVAFLTEAVQQQYGTSEKITLGKCEVINEDGSVIGWIDDTDGAGDVRFTPVLKDSDASP